MPDDGSVREYRPQGFPVLRNGRGRGRGNRGCALATGEPDEPLRRCPRLGTDGVCSGRGQDRTLVQVPGFDFLGSGLR